MTASVRIGETARRCGAKLLPADRAARVLRLRDGRLIGYAEYGDAEGAAVLALHGTPGSRLIFRLADALAAQRNLRLIVPDRPGYGLSSPPGGGAAALARAMAELADALALEHLSLIGVSGGGPYAVACGLGLAPRVRALALVSPVGLLSPSARLSIQHRFTFQGLADLPWLGALTFHAMRWALDHAPDLAYRGLVNRAAPADRPILMRAEVKATLIEAILEGLRGGVEGARQDVRLFACDWRLDLAGVTVPARLWQGTEDRTVPAEAAYELAVRLPSCELVRIEGAGHYWVFAGFGEVLDWLTTQDKARAA